MTPPPDRDFAAQCWSVTAILGCFLCLLQLGAMLSVMIGHLGFPMVAPTAFILALIVGVRLERKAPGKLLRGWLPCLLALAIVVISVTVSAFYYDLSWDGQWYHQTAIIRIANDWNPLADPMRSFTKDIQEWVRHYPKGPWYSAATVYRLTGHIETGKCFTWIALAAMFLGSLAALLEMGFRRATAIFLALLIALNPAVVSELTGFMVDGIMFSFLTVAIASMISALRSPSRAASVAGVAAGIVAINAKFTGLVFLCFAIATAALWCWVRKRAHFGAFVGVACGVLLLGTCVWGYNPYITNTVFRHQPFYPVLGSQQYPSIDHIENGETPRNLKHRNRFLRFGYAVFGRPGNQPYYIGHNATLMWPFAARPADLYSYTFQETRVAGFGPWFSGVVILSLALTAWLVASRPSARWTLLLLSAAVVTSLLISRHLWWPRYGPQMWFLPIAPMIVALQSGSSRPQRLMAWTAGVVLLVNALIVAEVRMNWETSHSIALRGQLKEMQDSGHEYWVNTQYFRDSTRVRLGEASVRYQDVGMQKLPDGKELVSVVEHYPAAIRYQPVGNASPFATQVLHSSR